MAHRIELPLFPLNTVLFPGSRLPLKIFEPRYVEMTTRCVRDDSSFGVCLIREGNEVGEPALPASVGCTARIAQWDMPHPNLFHLLTHGERRFRVLGTEVSARGLIMSEAELLPEESVPGEPEPLCRDVLAQLIDRIGRDRFASEIRLDDAAWVAYRLAELLPLSMELRQRLLEEDTAQARLTTLRELLKDAGIASAG